MKIESIKLQGFKSFRGETILSFNQNITAVVGPNGVGKSNVADAFRWVLGEQSVKTLRGRESTDVIFAGTDKQSRLSRALVEVKFKMEGDVLKKGEGSHPKGDQPLAGLDFARDDREGGRDDKVNGEERQDVKEDSNEEASPEDDSTLNQLAEVEITRKIYSSGEAHYLINNQEARLLDIQLFLAGHNVGQKNYAVVGQGMIDEILRLSPQDRLDFFYEATGVKKYQIKLHKAGLKLTRSGEHLRETEVLLKEITPHKKYLAAQAERYVRRKAIIDELAEKQTKYYRTAFWEVEQAYQSKRGDFTNLEREEVKISEEIKGLEAESAQIKKGTEGREQYQETSRELKQKEYERERLRSKLQDLSRQKELRLEEQGNFDAAFLYRRTAEVKDLLNQLEAELNELKSTASESAARSQAKAQELALVKSKIDQFKDTSTLSPEALVAQLQEILGLTQIAELKKQIRALIESIELSTGRSDLADLRDRQNELLAESGDISIQIKMLAEKERLLRAEERRYREESRDLELKLKSQANLPAGEWLQEGASAEEACNKQADGLDLEIKGLMERLNAWNKSEEERQLKIYDWQRRYQEASNQAKHLNELLQAVKIELARLEFRREQLAAEMAENLPPQVMELVKLQEQLAAEPLPITPADLRALRGEVKKLKDEAATLGEVDEAVVAEYQQVKTRYDFLTEQSTDLMAAIATLSKIIRKLEKRIKHQFEEKFAVLNHQFDKYFKILFSGGRAEIVQLEDPETHELGVEISAIPPGKKIKHIMTLSGGERSLVAAALICAIISSTPPPFVILDEIDAALDEANSNRLADILKGLAKDTQLILITHNRAIMEIADVLYGVTMSSAGVSGLVGVRMEDYE